MRASHSARALGRPLHALELLDQPGGDVLGVADDGDERRDVLADLGRVHVDVDDLGVRREGLELAGDAVVEARPEGDEQVALVHRVVGGDGAVHAEHAHGELVRLGEGAEPMSVVATGSRRSSASSQDLGGGVGGDHAAAQVEHRPLRPR